MRRARAGAAIAVALLVVSGAIGLAEGCAKPTPLFCDINSDCDEGYYCSGLGKCEHQCADAQRDCAVGQTCNANGQCEDVGSGGAGSSSSSSSGSPTTSTTTSGPGSTTSTGPSMTTSTSSGMAGAGELDLCSGTPDCEGGLHCRALSKGGAMRCTRGCSTSADCPSGLRCDDPGDGTTVCLSSDIGRTCTQPTDCHFGCLTTPKVCTEPCSSGADCPNGWGCMAIGSQKVCVKAEAYCDNTDASACIVPAACDLSSQMILGGCTLVCDTAADCPRRANGLTPWSCDAGGICRRPGDVYGPLETGYNPTQYYCNGAAQVVNLCNDAQHLDFDAFSIPSPPPVNCQSGVTTDGIPSDSCVDSCRYQGGCPFGSACTAVGGVSGARIGLCLPTGFGDVGASCAHDRDCLYGYCAQGKCSRDCTKDGVCPTGSTCTNAGGPPVEGQPFRRCQ